MCMVYLLVAEIIASPKHRYNNQAVSSTDLRCDSPKSTASKRPSSREIKLKLPASKKKNVDISTKHREEYMT